jgi:hypothetical protein
MWMRAFMRLVWHVGGIRWANSPKGSLASLCTEPSRGRKSDSRSRRGPGSSREVRVVGARVGAPTAGGQVVLPDLDP